ncbi:RNA-binding protein [Candidatus Microgenomates bacterium]|nr:RNA-binding protein [Candidatus Microgenomates bacterium]
MAKNLYVGNLSFDVDTTKLGEIFGAAGTVVSTQVITDRYSGRSRGFGFVEMSTDEEAQKAIEMFNGKDVDGRALVVNEARPREERPREDRPRRSFQDRRR